MTLFLLLAAALAADHAEANPVFRALREQGVVAGADPKVVLPEPMMADGLDAAAQREVLKKIVGSDVPLDEFLRMSAVSPSSDVPMACIV